MSTVPRFVVAACVTSAVLACVLRPGPVGAQDAADNESTPASQSSRTPEQQLKALVGSWKGTCRTWLRPGQEPFEDEITGTIQALPAGPLVRHTYRSQLQGRARSGEETIAWNGVAGTYQISWFDDFHMNYGILFSEGPAQDDGFQVVGQYAVGNNQPPWGWRTEFRMTDDNHLTITAWNVLPDGREAKAVEVQYTRQQ